ncbi:hypothetical protein ES703_90452 [subsurface metagenome]
MLKNQFRDNQFQNRKPRLNEVRNRLSVKDPDLDNLLAEYSIWVNYTEWLVFEGLTPSYQVQEVEFLISETYPGVGPLVKPGDWIFDVQYKVAKASKRGNDVYNWRVKKRLKLLHKAESMPSTLGYFSRGIARPLSSALLTTLTYNPQHLGVGEAWA